MVNNHHTDTLAKFIMSRYVELLRVIPMRVILRLSIQHQEVVLNVEHEKSWMDNIRAYIEHKALPDDRNHAKIVKKFTPQGTWYFRESCIREDTQRHFKTLDLYK